MKKGFTLVELAIVIVILGIITSGILGAQSLIRSSQITSTVLDAGKYITAVRAFQLEYDSMPGDMSDATLYWGKNATDCNGEEGTASATGTCNGDGDKEVVNDTTDYEHILLWHHLSLAEIVSGYNGQHSSGVLQPGVNVPKADIDDDACYIFRLHGQSFGRTQQGLQLGSLFATANTRCFDGVVSPKDARAIDRKADDGVPYTGNVHINDVGGSSSCLDNGSNTIPSNLILTTTDKVCRLWFWY